MFCLISNQTKQKQGKVDNRKQQQSKTSRPFGQCRGENQTEREQILKPR